MLDARSRLGEIGERAAVKEMIDIIRPGDALLDGLGHDAAFLDIPVSTDEVIVVYTDRSGLNIAYKLGLADASCVGDLAVSHAVSDLVAAGAQPKAVTVAVLAPSDTEIGFLREVMTGADEAARRYGAFIAGGDTKQNPAFALVVTAIGIAKRHHRLRRSSAQPGDRLMVTGHLGAMFMGTIAFKEGWALSGDAEKILRNALICQRPPYGLGRAMAEAGVASACMDISDGLAGALHTLSEASNVGAVVDESLIPIHKSIRALGRKRNLGPMHLALAGGDWQFLYSVPPANLAMVEQISRAAGFPIQVVGEVLSEKVVAVKTMAGDFREMLRVEHDSFADGTRGPGHFERLANPTICFGAHLPPPALRTAASQD